MPDEKPDENAELKARVELLEKKLGLQKDTRTPKQKQDAKLAQRRRH